MNLVIIRFYVLAAVSTILPLSHTRNSFAFASSHANELAAAATEEFAPQVAFKCGYRNQYVTKDGRWTSDSDRNAVCLHGKLDILKYCRKVYRSHNITNIVESFDKDVLIKNWCKPEGQPCKSNFRVQTFKCIGNEYKHELKSFPDDCRLDRAEDNGHCEDFEYYKKKAQENCAASFRPLLADIKSFNVYKPCGLDMFSAYEYVCCPVENKSQKPINNFADDDDESEEDDNEDDEQDLIDEEASTIRIDASGSRLHSKSGGEEISSEPNNNYYRSADLDNEPENYRDAVDTLERNYHHQFAEIMKNWTAKENKYKSLADKTSKQARDFREHMTEDYQNAVTRLEQNHKQERRRLSEVHEQRMWADFHERFRAAADNLRSWTRNFQAGSVSTTGVLRAVRYVVKLAERNRARALNRYRRLLGIDAELAARGRKRLLQRLLDADSAVNKTFDILKMVSGLEKKILPFAIEFWQEFRENQTPDVKDDTILWLGDKENLNKLLTYYEKNPIATEDTDLLKPKHKLTEPNRRTFSKNKQNEHEKINDAEKKEKKYEKISPSNFLQSKLHDNEVAPKAVYSGNNNLKQQRGFYLTYLIFSIGGVVVLVLAIAIIGVVRRRSVWNRRHGFIEVDGCSPEERHVTSMQGSGYENPTYKYFEQRRA